MKYFDFMREITTAPRVGSSICQLPMRAKDTADSHNRVA